MYDGIEDEERRHHDGGDADGHVDVEDPAPRVAIGKPAAENGAEHGSDDDAESPEAHGLAAVFAAGRTRAGWLARWAANLRHTRPE